VYSGHVEQFLINDIVGNVDIVTLTFHMCDIHDKENKNKIFHSLCATFSTYLLSGAVK